VYGIFHHIDALEEGFIIIQRIHGHPAFAHQAAHAFIVAVGPMSGPVIGNHRQGIGALGQQKFPARVGLLGGSESGYLADMQAPGKITGLEQAARIGILPGKRDIFLIIDIGNILW